MHGQADDEAACDAGNDQSGRGEPAPFLRIVRRLWRSLRGPRSHAADPAIITEYEIICAEIEADVIRILLGDQ